MVMTKEMSKFQRKTEKEEKKQRNDARHVVYTALVSKDQQILDANQVLVIFTSHNMDMIVMICLLSPSQNRLRKMRRRSRFRRKWSASFRSTCEPVNQFSSHPDPNTS
jgi:hypothetical protein